MTGSIALVNKSTAYSIDNYFKTYKAGLATNRTYLCYSGYTFNYESSGSLDKQVIFGKGIIYEDIGVLNVKINKLLHV